ncbi:AraC family transcriptional regulator [Roseateles sp. BYS180W]|uniref:AraC family transcriptional regulator n=1 Tax=Roseateles rivi TaxID=3299028 RepID=UPI003747947A
MSSLTPVVNMGAPLPLAARELGRAWRASTQRRELFCSADRDCAQAMVARVFCPHRLEPASVRLPLAARMEYLGAGQMGLSCLSYGAPVDITPGPLERFYLLQVPLAGQAQLRHGREAFGAHTACASLLSPAPDLAMHWERGNVQLILRIDAEFVQRFVRAWCGAPLLHAPTFAPQVALDQHPALLDLLVALIDVAGRASAAQTAHELPLMQLQYQILAQLLSAIPHDLQAQLHSSSPPIPPGFVRRVEDYMVAHCSEALTPEALAAVVGVSVRSLFLGFARYRGISPMRLLRKLRLQGAHDDLLHAAPGQRVTDVALRWGFVHLGRFSQEYLQAFGETPRQTLRAAGQSPLSS